MIKNYSKELLAEVKKLETPQQTDVKPAEEISSLPLLNPYLYSDELIAAIDELEAPQKKS